MTREIGRLRQRRDFLRVAAERRKVVTHGLIVQARKRDDGLPDIRVGFTASRKVGNAVRRNFARRRLRELVRELLGDLGVPSTDYVMIARNTTVTRPWQLLRGDMTRALRQLSLRKAD